MRAGLGVVFVFVFSCAPSVAVEKRELLSIERRLANLRTADSEDAKLQQEVLMAIKILRKAQDEYIAAAASFEKAKAEAEEAEADYKQAVAHWKETQQNYRRAAYIVLVAAGTDAIGQAICGNVMSTQAFRRKMALEGQPVDPTEDVDHIWPRAHGGVDHEWNYHVLPQRLNRQLGAKVLPKVMEWPLKTLRGFVVSAIAHLRC